jgi:hypothetical protein
MPGNTPSDFDDMAAIAKAETDPGIIINKGSPFNTRSNPERKRPKDMGLHGQPGNKGRRDSDRRR